MGIFNLTESEKKEILSLHNNAKVIKEQAETQQAAPTTQQAAPTTQPLNPIDKIKLIQTTLIDKYKMVLGNTGEKKDGVDGSLGPKTLDAIAKVIKSKTAPVVQEPVVQEPVVQEPVVQEPVVQEPVVKEPVVKTDSLSNRDQRRERQDLRRSNRKDMQNLRAGQQGQQQ